MSNILSTRRLLDRRLFLRGMGATVALPLLEAMLPTRTAAAAAEAAKPARSVFVYIPNGVNVWTWQINEAGKKYDLSEPLKPLERFRAEMTPISGLSHYNGANANHMCGDTWLTGAKVDITGASSYRNSVSCDQVMAEVAGVHTRYQSLELSLNEGVGTAGASVTLAFTRDGMPLPAEENPRHVFDRLFGANPDGIAAQRRDTRRNGSVLDAILEDANSLKNSLGTGDQAKLDEYLHSVRDVERRVKRLDSWLDVPKPKLNPDTGEHFHRSVSKEQAGEYYRTMYDLMVLALRTDMTRVISYMSGTESNGLAIPEIGLTQSRHELSHHNGDPEIKAKLAKSDFFLVQQFAYFLDELKKVKEGDESLLDRTMVLFGSGMSYGHSHGNANLPTVLAGGTALGLRHGQHLDYNLPRLGGSYEKANLVGLCHTPVDDKARLCNLLLTMMQKMGVRTESFVDSTGPISELLA